MPPRRAAAVSTSIAQALPAPLLPSSAQRAYRALPAPSCLLGSKPQLRSETVQGRAAACCSASQSEIWHSILAAAAEHGATGPACACMLADARRMHLSMWARAEAGSAPVQRTRKKARHLRVASAARCGRERASQQREGKSVASAPDEGAPGARRGRLRACSSLRPLLGSLALLSKSAPVTSARAVEVSRCGCVIALQPPGSGSGRAYARACAGALRRRLD
jgi:hypothetical protein